MHIKNETGQPSPESPVTSKGVDARQRIVAAAESLFNLHGFDRTSMRDIASEARMQAASMYYHFPSKDELLWAVWEKGGIELLQRANDAATSTGGPWSRMEAMCVAHITGLLDWRKTNQVLFVMPPSQYPASIRDRVIALRDEYERVFASIINDLPMKHGTDKDLFRRTLIGALSWSLYWFKPGGNSPEVIAQQMLSLMRDGVQAEKSGNRAS